MRYVTATVLLLGMLGLTAPASEGVDAVIKLRSNGVSEPVMLAFVQHSSVAYDPSPEEIRQMESEGVSASVIVAMVDSGRALRGQGPTIGAPAAKAGAGSEPTASTQPVAPPRETGKVPPNPSIYKDREVSGDVSATVYVPADDELDISYFYESMSPHGTWYRDSSYGWVWRPTVVEVGWRPYVHNGHWAWTDHGWYWESSYPWGWAAFHYGRWYEHPHHHWVWVPDTTWGPAWVTWRHSDSHYGWAPLPPHARFEAGVGFHFGAGVGVDFGFGLSAGAYAFVPVGGFLDVHLGGVILPHTHSHRIYNQTKIVNNTYVYNDNRIINNGIPVTQVRAATRQSLEPVKVAAATAAPGQAVQPEKRGGNTITAFKPEVKKSAPLDPQQAASRRML